MKNTYKVTDEIYIARILTGMTYVNSCLDDRMAINEHLPLVPILKSINSENVDDYKVKGTDVQAELYESAKRKVRSRSVSLGFLIDLAISSLHANDGVTSYDLANLLSEKLHYSKSGLYGYQLQKVIKEYFNPDEIISRQKLDEFCDYVLNDYFNNEKIC